MSLNNRVNRRTAIGIGALLGLVKAFNPLEAIISSAASEAEQTDEYGIPFPGQGFLSDIGFPKTFYQYPQKGRIRIIGSGGRPVVQFPQLVFIVMKDNSGNMYEKPVAGSGWLGADQGYRD